MAWRSIVPGRGIPDVKEDAKSAVSFGAFRLSDRAVYLAGREYLPLAALEKVRLYSSRLNTQGCCGLGVPVWYVLLYHGAEKPVKLLAETREKAEEVLGRITALQPSVEVMPPHEPPSGR